MYYPNLIKNEVCEMICVDGASTTYIADLYNIPLKTVENWVTAYNKNPNCYKSKPNHLRPVGCSVSSKSNKKKYGDMSKEELRLEVMRRDVELARLKKGYMVRESGGKLEYGIFSDQIMK